MHATIFILLLSPLIVRDQPLAPAWAPDHQALATTKVSEAFATPEGGNYQLLLNGRLMYPRKPKHSWFHTYEDQHTFLSKLAWSPDSQRLALVEEVYDWEYTDPYNRYFDGTVSRKGFYLAIIDREGKVSGYKLADVPEYIRLSWLSPETVVLNDRTFDLRTNLPRPIR